MKLLKNVVATSILAMASTSAFAAGLPFTVDTNADNGGPIAPQVFVVDNISASYNEVV